MSTDRNTFTRGQRVHVQEVGAAIFRRWDDGLAVVRVLNPTAANDPDLYCGADGVIVIDPNLITTSTNQEQS